MTWKQEEEDDFMPSLSKFEAMLKTNKVFFFDSQEFEDIIYHYIDTGKIALAKKALKLAYEQHPKSQIIKMVEVEILIYENKLDLAERLLNELLEIDPSNEDIYFNKASILSKKGKHQESIEQYLLALKYTDTPADAYSLIGMEYLYLDDVESAKDNFILCLKEDINDVSALYNIAYCFDFLDQHKQAVDFLNWYIDECPYSEVAWHQLGREYYILEDYENALRAFDYAILIDEEFLGAYLEKGKTLEKLGRYEEAIEFYNTASSMEDPTPYTFYRIGKSFQMIGAIEHAITNFSLAVENDPTYENAWLALVDLYVNESDLNQALTTINQALEIDPENELYWKRYASIQYAMDNYDQAYHGYEKAIELGSEDIDVFLNYADFKIAYSEYDEAIEILLSVIEHGKELTDVYYRLAGLYLIKADKTNALYYLNEALLSDLLFDKLHVFKELFKEFIDMDEVQLIIDKHMNR